MTSKRTLEGFLHDGSFDFANPVHYKKALEATDYRKEEYWYQSVFHSPSQANSLTKEVFQKKIRNACKVYQDQEGIIYTEDADVKHEIENHEMMTDRKSTSISSDPHLLAIMNSGFKTDSLSFSVFLSEIERNVRESDLKLDAKEDIFKYLAFILLKTGVATYVDDEDLLKLIPGIETYLTDLSDTTVQLKVRHLNDYVGTRYRADAAKYNLIDIITRNFPEEVDVL